MSWNHFSALLPGRLFAASLELAVLAAIVALGIRLMRLRSPRTIALLWLLVMAKPLVSLFVGPLVPVLAWAPAAGLRVEEERERRASTAGGPEEAVVTNRTVWRSPAAPALLRAAGPWLKGTWITGALVVLLFGIWDRRRLGLIIARATPASPALRSRLASLAARLGVRRPPALLVTDRLESPALARTFVPVILLPRWLAEEGSAEQLDWSFRHELTHWRMRDPWAGALRQVLQTVFFFHPVAWWAGKRWEEAAERACDRALVTTREEAACYAERLYEMLVKAGAQRRLALASGLFATRTQIGRRIAALLQDPLEGPPRLSARRRIGLALVAAAVLSVGAGSLEVSAGDGRGRADLQLSEGDWSARFEAEGSWEFTADGTDIASLSPGSYVSLEQTRGGPNRRLEIRALEDGAIERTYIVDGKRRDFDDEARDWMTHILPEFARIAR